MPRCRCSRCSCAATATAAAVLPAAPSAELFGGGVVTSEAHIQLKKRGTPSSCSRVVNAGFLLSSRCSRRWLSLSLRARHRCRSPAAGRRRRPASRPSTTSGSRRSRRASRSRARSRRSPSPATTRRCSGWWPVRLQFTSDVHIRWPLTAPPPGARAGGGGGFVFGIILGALPGAQMDTLDQTQKAQRLHGFRPKVRLRSAPCAACRARWR